MSALTRNRIISVYARLVCSEPVVAVLVLSHGVHASGLQVAHVSIAKHHLVHTPHVCTNPHLSTTVKVKTYHVYVRKACFVIYIFLVLVYSLFCKVQDKQS